MSYGVIEYDSYGNPICELCGKSFKRVMSHVRYKHSMTAREYKTQFGFDVRRGICSEESASKSRMAVWLNYEQCIEGNLIHNGEKSRFVEGHPGRTGDIMSEQTRLRLVIHVAKLKRRKVK